MMNMTEIRKKALLLNMDPGKMKKADLIHAIQAAEGNQQCYGHSHGSCPYTGCCFRSDCLRIKD